MLNQEIQLRSRTGFIYSQPACGRSENSICFCTIAIRPEIPRRLSVEEYVPLVRALLVLSPQGEPESIGGPRPAAPAIVNMYPQP